MMFKSGAMKNIMGGVGAGMIAVGSVDLLKDFGVLSGADDEVLEISLNGDQDILAGYDDDLAVVNASVLAEDDDLAVVNGDDDEDFG